MVDEEVVVEELVDEEVVAGVLVDELVLDELDVVELPEGVVVVSAPAGGAPKAVTTTPARATTATAVTRDRAPRHQLTTLLPLPHGNPHAAALLEPDTSTFVLPPPGLKGPAAKD